MRCSTSLTFREIHIKPQEDTTPHPLEELKLKMLTIPSVAGDIEQKELSYVADGNEK